MRNFQSMALAIIALATVQARAVDVYWTNMNSSANWSDPGVWKTATPGVGDTANFTNNNTYTVNFPTGTGVTTTNHAFSFLAGNATVYLNIGPGNTWVLTNNNLSSITGGTGSNGKTNAVTLTSGTLVLTNGSNSGVQIGASSSTANTTPTSGSLTISNGATLLCQTIRPGVNGAGNGTLTIAGGAVTVYNRFTLGNQSNSVGTVWVLGGTLQSTPAINVGSANFSTGSMTISNGTIDASAAGINVGSGATGARGTLTVAGGLVLASQLTVGQTASTGTVFVTNGGVLEANTITLGAHAGNVVTNDGGVYQFTQATPTLTVAGSGGISINNGVISFRDVSSFNLTNNTGSTGVGAITYSGDNTLRLTGTTTATNTVAAGYTFDSFANTGNAKIYKGLEMINGTTAIAGNGITIGTAGSFLASNTTATVSGIFTNRGTVEMKNSVATFNRLSVNSGAWITDPTTNIFNATHIETASGYLSAAAGDVFIFRSNFVNQSTQSTSYDTFNTTPGGSGAAGTKFIFDSASTGYTQQFYTAGLTLTGGFIGTPTPSSNGAQGVSSFGAVTGFVDNFALDRLEIGNAGTNSTLQILDTFGTVSADDGKIAGLFVNDLWIFGTSQLILSNNVRLYFVNSNNWSMANITLLGNAEIHQLALMIPEPAVLVIWLAGLVTVWASRRRRPGGNRP